MQHRDSSWWRFRRAARIAAGLLALFVAGLLGHGAGGAAHAQAVRWSCMVTGGGALADGDSFGGSVRGEVEPFATGTWIHVTPDGDVFRGTADSLSCRSDGGAGAGPPQEETNRATVFGTGSWNGEDGFEFAVRLADRGEPGDDEYVIVILDPEGEVQHMAVDILAGGNIQIHAR